VLGHGPTVAVEVLSTQPANDGWEHLDGCGQDDGERE
jgi:hypothetical protein